MSGSAIDPLGEVWNQMGIISTNMPRGRKRAMEVKEEEGPEAEPKPHERAAEGSGEEEAQGEEGHRENTLTVLTRRFIELIKSREGLVLDINEATNMLQVQKRRIYDINNVLQGIGYIEKIHKNKMRWIGGSRDLEINREIAEIDEEIQDYSEKHREIDEAIRSVREQLAAEAQSKRYLNYLTEEDLREVLERMEGAPRSMLVVMAQEGTTVQQEEGAVVVQKPAEVAGSLSSYVMAKKGMGKEFDFREG